MGADSPEVQGLLAIALDRYSLLMAGAVFVLLRSLKKTGIAKLPVYWRFLPVLPDVLGVAATLLGGVPVVAKEPVVVQVAAGLWIGYLSQRFHKICGQSILGDDPDIEANRKQRPPEESPQPPKEGT